MLHTEIVRKATSLEQQKVIVDFVKDTLAVTLGVLLGGSMLMVIINA